ncbi:cathepsin L-like [Gigantopelta aegis]|uniref:cathepsin L-like n=1 Tax=Gigantopelta aegis TaxID=1735272 RepID=UPI001B88C5B6|nr:cathepsin L-like [Gigantopelta aegis]
MDEIEQLNRKFQGKTEFAINAYADMSPKEFRETMLMPRRAAPVFEKERLFNVEVKGYLPQSFDWTDKGVVTSVKNQGTVGTCWAFSTIGNIEGQWAMQGNILTDLSVEQVVDCDSTKDPANDRADCGVFGGWPYLAYQYIKKVGGIEPEVRYPYCSGNGGCYPCPAPGYNKTLCGPAVPSCLKNESCHAKLDPGKFIAGLNVTDWKAIDKNETLIAFALMKLGPLSVAFDASLLQFYHKGIYDPPLCSKTELDHAVLMVGFGEDKELFKEKPYWKIKNSWGSKWGESGYFRILRGKGTCGINTQVTTAVLAT